MLLNGALYLLVFFVFLWTVVPTLWAHTWDEHREALYKCGFIWLLSTLPVIASLALSDYSTSNFSEVIYQMSGSPFSMSEQIVYASAFLAPVLFIFITAIRALLSGGGNKAHRFRQVLRSYHRVLLPALLLMLISMLAFAGIKTDPEAFERTVFYHLFYDKCIFIYFASMVYWYCVVIIEEGLAEDYAIAADGRTRSFLEAAAERLGGGKNG